MTPEHEGEAGAVPVSHKFQVNFQRSALDSATLASAVAELTEHEVFARMSKSQKAQVLRFLAETYAADTEH